MTAPSDRSLVDSCAKCNMGIEADIDVLAKLDTARLTSEPANTYVFDRQHFGIAS